mmetsp:Transcript_85473/g.228570  ORF Transcript_85473/g.228570 Transcript_85473/m.228570 type:complete len:85 (-) Transcript_85473:3454-3708(-)
MGLAAWFQLGLDVLLGTGDRRGDCNEPALAGPGFRTGSRVTRDTAGILAVAVTVFEGCRATSCNKCTRSFVESPAAEERYCEKS